MTNPPVTVEDDIVGNSAQETVQFDWAGDTVVGKVRRVNEDAFGCRSGLFVVADGMGGHDAGDVASRTVVDRLVDSIPDTPVPLEILERTITTVNTEVRDQAAATGHVGMGATLVALVWVQHQAESYLALVNVGDSRGYLVDADGFRRVTHDHSLVQELVDSGEISPNEAQSHPDRNVVTRAMGVDPDVLADYVLLPAAGRQRVLLCSDGVSSQLDDGEVESILVDAKSPGRAVGDLIASVMTGRAPDNATAVVVDVEWMNDHPLEDDEAEITSPRGGRADDPGTPATGVSIVVPVAKSAPLAPPQGPPLISSVPRAQPGGDHGAGDPKSGTAP